MCSFVFWVVQLGAFSAMLMWNVLTCKAILNRSPTSQIWPTLRACSLHKRNSLPCPLSAGYMFVNVCCCVFGGVWFRKYGVWCCLWKGACMGVEWHEVGTMQIWAGVEEVVWRCHASRSAARHWGWACQGLCTHMCLHLPCVPCLGVFRLPSCPHSRWAEFRETRCVHFRSDSPSLTSDCFICTFADSFVDSFVDAGGNSCNGSTPKRGRRAARTRAFRVRWGMSSIYTVAGGAAAGARANRHKVFCFLTTLTVDIIGYIILFIV